MSTPTTGQSEDKTRYGRQIEEAFEHAAKLAGSNLAPTEFYEQFLNRALTAIDAPAGAVWLRTPQGFLQVACQLNLDKVGLDSRNGGRQCHNEVLRQVFQAAPPRPIILEPNGRMAPGPGEPGPVPPANLTNHFALFAPIVTADKQSLGVLEVFQDPTHDPRLYPAFLNYAFQMAGYASQYHQFISARSGSGAERTFVQVEAFARSVHASLDPTAVAYVVANEGRKLIECDRLCVGVRHSRRKVTVEAVSGADVVEKASTHVVRLRHLMEAVLQWGDPLIFKGAKDAGMPPAVAAALDEYLHESQPKLLVVKPFRDAREKDAARPARSVLVLESFNPPENADPLVQRLDVVGAHAAPALYNAAELKRVPLKFLWWPLAKLQEGVGGKTKFFTLLAVALLAVLIGCLAVVPYPLRMEAKGQLVPVETAQLFAKREGIIRDIHAKPGAQVPPDFAAITLFSERLQKEIQDAQGRLNEATGKVTSARLALDLLPKDQQSEGERIKYLSELALAEFNARAAEKERNAILAQYRADERQPGVFYATAPPFDLKRVRPGGAPARWTVVSEDRSELRNKTVQPDQELIRVGNLEGEWHVEEKIPQRNIGQILRAFADPRYHKQEPDTKRKYLDVDILLSSRPDASYLGRLYEDDIVPQAVPNKTDHDETEPVVTAYVKLSAADLPEAARIPGNQFVTGLEVRTRIRCGDHSLGYSLFHGVWEWFYESVVFFF